MHRRDFLKFLGVLMMGAMQRARAGEGNALTTATSRKRIAFIGTGMADEWELQTQGYEVVVVEARDPIKGRIWTSTMWPTMLVDVGATWIHGVRSTPLTGVADEIQARRLVTSYVRATAYNTSGRLLSVAEAEGLDQLRAQVFTALRSCSLKNFTRSRMF